MLAILFLTPFTAHAAEKESVYDRVIRTGTLKCGYFIWPPYMQKDPATNQFSGIYYDVIESLGKALNLK